MGYWLMFWKFIQIYSLVAIIIALVVYTMMILFSKIGLNAKELYKDYLEEYEKSQIEDPDEEHKFSEREVVFTVYLFKAIIIFVLPASILIYRQRLLGLHAFMIVKKHEGRRKGLAYNNWLAVSNRLFCLTSMQNKNYMEYIIYRNENNQRYGKQAETASFTILVLNLSLFYYYASINLNEFFMPLEYMLVLFSLLFQRGFIFILKIAIFWPCYAIYLLAVCGSKSKCCKKRKKSKTETSKNTSDTNSG